MKYFKRSEFACKCGCGFDTVDFELAVVLDRVREYYEKPVIINSAARCLDHNRVIGGAGSSQHLLGKAADFYVRGVDSSKVAKLLRDWYPAKYGIGEYSNRVHIDVRSNPARWLNK